MTTRPDVSAPAGAVRSGRGRRPAAEVRESVLAAASALLFESGLAAVTFEKVAARAGASKMTLYKWWPTPGSLALDAYFHAVEGTLAFPDTGDVEADVRTQLRAFVGLVTGDASPVITGLIGAAQSDSVLAVAFAENYTRPRRLLAVERLGRAQRAGEIRADVDLEVVVDQLWGACYHRLLLPDQPLNRAFADALVDTLWRGLRP
ncbi:TetR/AcrR family transcriptional regulator [Subtercola sp. YIM 133946]|uniref:TetR/AcrR family transcriptional regulator n=1 Tax=Subtercola sp. YIM 133946 TaxID=3118909 RepID=UPI002F922CFC